MQINAIVFSPQGRLEKIMRIIAWISFVVIAMWVVSGLEQWYADVTDVRGSLWRHLTLAVYLVCGLSLLFVGGVDYLLNEDKKSEIPFFIGVFLIACPPVLQWLARFLVISGRVEEAEMLFASRFVLTLLALVVSSLLVLVVKHFRRRKVTTAH